MSELHLKGYIGNDYHGIIALDEKISDKNEGNSIISSIENFANENGLCGPHKKGLGGTRSIIDNCNIKIYFTDKECELEEAIEAFEVLLYGGDVETKVDKVGYSEYTITGLVIDKFKIGGHDLEAEIRSHYGEYMHFIIEC
jgi:hypothetical protein